MKGQKKLFKSHANLQTLTQIVNQEFQKIVYFFSSHKLSLHPEKTKFILFSSTRVQELPNIFIDFNEPNAESITKPIIPMCCINNSDQPYIRFLGVLFDPQLNFKKHISFILSKLAKSLYFLKSSKNILNERSLKLFYYATFHSHLVYANQIWTSTFESNLKPVFIKQKAAIRIICEFW